MGPVDPFDAFSQELLSKDLLDDHGATLVADAREVLNADPEARVAGMIMLPDSPEAPAFRAAVERLTGQALPAGLSVGICPRQMVEELLTARVPPEQWREEAWQDQQVLAVVVATKDGFRFGFFGLCM